MPTERPLLVSFMTTMATSYATNALTSLKKTFTIWYLTMMLRIEAKHFVAGVILDRYVHTAAPIVKYMKGWNAEQVFEYCASKGWKVNEVKE